jgi:hypothetical protein
MKKWINQAFRWYYRQRYKGIEYFMRHPHEVQRRWLSQLLNSAKYTEWGKRHRFNQIHTPEDFSRMVPLQDYESIKPYIQRMMHGERDVLWSGQVQWFSKSSGTTSDKSKFLPVSSHNLKKCHIRGTWDNMALDNRADIAGMRHVGHHGPLLPSAPPGTPLRSQKLDGGR